MGQLLSIPVPEVDFSRDKGDHWGLAGWPKYGLEPEHLHHWFPPPTLIPPEPSSSPPGTSEQSKQFTLKREMAVLPHEGLYQVI